MQPLTETEHKKLEKICRKYCTLSLGWNPAKRRKCRDRTMCSELCVERDKLNATTR